MSHCVVLQCPLTLQASHKLLQSVLPALPCCCKGSCCSTFTLHLPHFISLIIPNCTSALIKPAYKQSQATHSLPDCPRSHTRPFSTHSQLVSDHLSSSLPSSSYILLSLTTSFVCPSPGACLLCRQESPVSDRNTLLL